MAETAGVYSGSDFITQLLGMLQQLGPQFGIQLPQSQAGIMQSMGFVNPNMLGVTDPRRFQQSFAPQLFREKGQKAVYMVDPETGQARWVENPSVMKMSGFDWNSVQEVNPGYLKNYTVGDPLKTGYTDWQKQDTLEKRGLDMQDAQQAYERSIRGLRQLPTPLTAGTGTAGAFSNKASI